MAKPGDIYRAAALLRPSKAKAARAVGKRLDEAEASRKQKPVAKKTTKRKSK